MSKNLRKILLGVIIIIALGVVVFRGDSLIELGATMQTGIWWLLVLAIVSQFGKYIAQSFAYAAAFKTVGERRRARDTLPLVFGSFFMNTIAPSFNTAGAMLVVHDSKERGIAPGKATTAALLMQMSIETGFLVIMTIGFIILQFAKLLDPVWFLVGLIVMLMIGVMAALLIVGHKSPNFLKGLLSPIEKRVDKLSIRFRKGKTVKPWVGNLVDSFSQAAGMIKDNPKQTVRVFIFSIVASTCELACFILVGVAFGVTNPGALIGGYCVATLFAMISITPQGVGVVELAVTALFAAYGIGAGEGGAIALVYRGLVFWLPFAIGAVMIRHTKSFKRKELPVPEQSSVDQ